MREGVRGEVTRIDTYLVCRYKLKERFAKHLLELVASIF